MSSAAELIEQATEAGVTLKLVDGEVKVHGSRAAVSALIGQLREVKADVIRILEDAAVPVEVQAEGYRLLTRVAKPPALPANQAQATTAAQAGPTVETPPPATQGPQPWHHITSAWRPLAAAYNLHHTACKTCQSAGQGRGLRCGTGAALWTRYSDSF